MTFEEYVALINRIYNENQHAKNWEVLDSNCNAIDKNDVVGSFGFHKEVLRKELETPFVIVPCD